MSNNINVTVIGSGSWGTALACASLRAGNRVTLWGRETRTLEEIEKSCTNSAYLPGITLEPGIIVVHDLAKAVSSADTILLVIPAQAIGGEVSTYQQIMKPSQKLIVCAKGIDRKTGKTPVELVSPLVARGNTGVLSGPSFATDVARGLPTAVTIAFDEMQLALELAENLSSDSLRAYCSDDVIGVELGGALKNVLAVAVGIARGLELGASAEAALIARGFGELTKLAVNSGAQPQTMTGLSGLGDLVLTASSTQSRNFSYGIALGKGENLENMPLAEGVYTARMAAKLAQRFNIDAPIIDSIGKVLDGELSATQAVQHLLSRPIRKEHE